MAPNGPPCPARESGLNLKEAQVVCGWVYKTFVQIMQVQTDEVFVINHCSSGVLIQAHATSLSSLTMELPLHV